MKIAYLYAILCISLRGDVFMCKCVYVYKRSSGLPAGHEENQNRVQLISPKRADLACSCLLWNALQVLGYLSNLTTLDYPVGLGMPKANIHCLGDPCGVCTLMNNLGFQEMRVGPRRKPVLLGGW